MPGDLECAAFLPHYFSADISDNCDSHEMSNPAQFGGEEHFRASPDRVYGLLTNLEAMTATIPDLVSRRSRIDEHTVRCVVRPGLSFLRGTLKLAISLADLQPSERAAMNVSAQGIGVLDGGIAPRICTSKPKALLVSKLTWQARFEEIRQLAWPPHLSPGLLKAAADQVVRHAWGSRAEAVGRVTWSIELLPVREGQGEGQTDARPLTPHLTSPLRR